MNTPESYYCNCTAGYFGTGFVCERMSIVKYINLFICLFIFIIIIAFCGDGLCDTSIDEMCLSCPNDCPTPCGMVFLL